VQVQRDMTIVSKPQRNTPHTLEGIARFVEAFIAERWGHAPLETNAT
jgi:hypothetical protein